MISAEWLFKNHCDHVSMARLLEIQLDTEIAPVVMTEQERNEEIAALVLSRQPFDGLPKAQGGHSNATERAVLALEQSSNTLQKHSAELQKQLSVYRYLIKTYDSLISILPETEQQFIDFYYNKQLSLTGMTEAAGSPVCGLSKTTVWTYKSKLLSKCDSLLHCLCPTLYTIALH